MTNSMINWSKPCPYFRDRFFMLILFFLFFITPQKATTQSSELEVGLINIGVGSVIGGIGAIINKEKNENFGQVLLKGFGQGALGGYLIFEAKRLTRALPEKDTYAFIYPAKILNAAGSSIIENAAHNDYFWTRGHMNIGFGRFEFYTKNEEVKFRYRISPFMLTVFIAKLADEDRIFSWDKTLQLGTPVFLARELGGVVDGRRNQGTASGSIIELTVTASKKTEAHELVHVFQYDQLSPINAFLEPGYEFLRKESGLFRFYDSYFYTDFQTPLRIFHNRVVPYDQRIQEKELDVLGL